MRHDTNPWTRQQYVMAVVLGTALTTLANNSASAAESTSPDRAISDISRYCTACWRNARLHPDSWNDCTQEVLVRLLERVAPETWGSILKVEGAERRELLRAIDTVKKRSQRQRVWSSRCLEAVADRRELREHRLTDEREAVRTVANRLSTRQQRILQLTVEGFSAHEIAEQLRLPPERVSDEKYKAIRKLRDYLAEANNG